MSKKLVEPMPLWQEKSQNAIERMRRLQACPFWPKCQCVSAGIDCQHKPAEKAS